MTSTRRHLLSDVDPSARSAACASCGSVSIVSNGNDGFICAILARNRHRARRERIKSDPDLLAKKREYHRNYAREYIWKSVGGRQANIDRVGGACEICGVDVNADSARMDHDHNCCNGCPSCFRGVLCNGCNSGLGFFADDRDALANAIAYLDRFAVRDQ